MAALLRGKYPFLSPSASVDHLVVGAGVVGLAIGERLRKGFPNRDTFVIERRAQAGQETSSRNSEVIHSGIYYPPDSLKSRLCIRGRDLLYQRPALALRKTGKLILATSADEVRYLYGLEANAKRIWEAGGGELEVPVRMLSRAEVREREESVGGEVLAALESPSTGIVSSHDLMDQLERGITGEDGETDEAEGAGVVAFGTKVVRIDRAEGGEKGWVVQTLTESGDTSSVLAKVVVNSAGLSSHHIFNQVLPPLAPRAHLNFAKGSYFSYRGPGISNITHLLYPCPTSSNLASLGTHLTLDLDGNVKFGPDINWLTAPLIKVPSSGEKEEEEDFWTRELQVDDDEGKRDEVLASVRRWLPGVEREGFQPDYVGIRPKLYQAGEKTADFSITHPFPGFVNLMGIESPGLTSSLAIGEMVEGIVRRECWREDGAASS